MIVTPHTSPSPDSVLKASAINLLELCWSLLYAYAQLQRLLKPSQGHYVNWGLAGYSINQSFNLTLLTLMSSSPYLTECRARCRLRLIFRLVIYLWHLLITPRTSYTSTMSPQALTHFSQSRKLCLWRLGPTCSLFYESKSLRELGPKLPFLCWIRTGIICRVQDGIIGLLLNHKLLHRWSFNRTNSFSH